MGTEREREMRGREREEGEGYGVRESNTELEPGIPFDPGMSHDIIKLWGERERERETDRQRE